MYSYFMKFHIDNRTKAVLFYTGLILFIVVIFYPALGSIFLLDDYQNLRGLGLIKTQGYIPFITSGMAGPTGRPLSLLSFALQYESWPADPFAFKLVNLFIHLFNGALLFYITNRLVSHLGLYGPGKSYTLSLVVSGIWLLHPVQLSSILYVVQRMTLLSGFFVLAGIAFYLHYRNKIFSTGKGKPGFIIAIYLCTLLAVMCKENGILLPVYVLCIELFLLSDNGQSKDWNKFVLPVLLLPVCITGLYFIFHIKGILAGYAYRDFTLHQRLVTEAGILIEYLKIIIIPHPDAFSLYHDDYPVSLPGLSTVIDLLAVGIMILAGYFLRRRLRVFAFAVFWFFSGHLLESGIIPLELYFEHRNYLPSYGVILLVFIALTKAVSYIKNTPFRLTLLVLYPILIILVTVMELNLWENPGLQAMEAVERHPGSRRALVNLWNVYIMTGNKEKSEETKHKLQSIEPLDLYPQIKDITVTYCYNNSSIDDDSWQRVINQAARAVSVHYDTINELNYIIIEITKDRCKFTDLTKLRELIYTLIHNNSFNRWNGLLYEYAASVSLLMNDSAGTLNNIRMAVSISPTIENKIYMLRILKALGKNEEAQSLAHELAGSHIPDLKSYIELRQVLKSLDNLQGNNVN